MSADRAGSPSLVGVTTHSPVSYKQALTSCGLSNKDIISSLDTFYGHKDKASSVVDPEALLRCSEGLDASLWKLSMAGIPAEQHVSLLIHKLQGPILSAFRAQSLAAQWSATSDISVFRDRLLSLFADRQVTYTEQLLALSFSVSSLVADLHKFGNLARYSAFRNNLNGNLFVYDLLRDKLNKAVPNALVIASTRYQLSLPRTESFQAYLDAAVTIAHKLQIDPSILPPKRAAEASPATAQTSSKKGKFETDRLAALSNTDLLNALGRCPDCGWLPNGAPMSQHVRDGKCLPDKLAWP